MIASAEKKTKAPAKQSVPKAQPNEPSSTTATNQIAFQLFTQPLVGSNTAQAAAGEPSPNQSSAKHEAPATNAVQPSAHSATRVARSPEPGAPPLASHQIIVDDGSPIGLGQISRTQFMETISADIRRMADEELQPIGQTARDCPYLDHWLNFYRDQSAERVERAVRHYARVDDATNSDQLREAVLARARTAVQAWVRSGGRDVQVPDGLELLGESDAAALPTEGGVVQRQAMDVGGTAPLSDNPATVRAHLNQGQLLGGTVRTEMERGFGQSFSNVRIHTDATAAGMAREFSARAFTVGNDVAFGSGEYKPGTLFGDALIAHELAHSIQQQGGEGTTARQPATHAVSDDLENDANRSAVRVLSNLWGYSGEISDSLRLGRFSTSHGPLKLSRCRRDPTPAPTPPRIPDPNGMGYNAILVAAGNAAEPAVRRLASLETGNGVLNLAAFTALSSNDALDVLALQRHATGTRCLAWFPTLVANAIAVTDPYGGASSVTAYYIPGISDRRAMIVGGVHNLTEPQGRVVVESLRTLLNTRIAATPSRPPFFTTILIPSLFDPALYDPAQGAGRWISGGMGRDVGGRLQTSRYIEPNRNFPLPGEGLATAQARGASGPNAAELMYQPPPATAGGTLPAVREPTDTSIAGGTGTSTRMLPQTRTLIGLIEHFRPERIASVHAHSLKSIPGDAPGIFIDPRGVNPTTGAVIDAAQRDEDRRLATAMVQAGIRRPITGAPSDPFIGNAPGTAQSRVEYASSRHAEGTSLGGWAPTPVTGAGARPGITTVTIEVPQWRSPRDAAQLGQIQDLDRDLLADIFLGDPASVTPATGPTTP